MHPPTEARRTVPPGHDRSKRYVESVGVKATRVTSAFLFTDIEASTRRWEQYPDAMMTALALHDVLLDEVIRHHGGRLFHRSGDGVIASFDSPVDALDTAVSAQQEFDESDWSAVGGLAVRMTVHVGEVVLRDGDPYGWALNFGSRLNAVGHGGQILLSGAAVEALEGTLSVHPAEASADAMADEPSEALMALRLGRHQLRDIALPAEVFELRTASTRRVFPPLRTTERTPELRSHGHVLVGRDRDIDIVAALLANHRLVTVVGPPGVGASEVAAAAVERVAAGRENAVQYCDLAGVSPQRMRDAIATTLGIGARLGLSVEQRIVEWMADHEVLLVVEHADHGIETVARVVRSLAVGAPRSTVLCTSHRPLGVKGESVYRLDPLDLDDAVSLFVERAAASGGSVAASAALRLLCDRLDRIPLAIEVVAASAAAYGVEQLLDMLERRELPGSADGEMPWPSIAEAIDLAIDSLTPRAQSMLRAATVFAGPFDTSAFGAVCAPGIDAGEANRALADLVSRSLIHTHAGSGQYALLHFVADVARRRLDPDERKAVTDRFIDVMIERAEEAAAGLRGAEELQWDRRVARQFGNFRLAFSRCVSSGDPGRAAAVLVPLWEYGFMRMNEEFFRWADRAVATFSSRADEALLAPMLGVAALGAWIRDDVDDANEWASRALRLEQRLDLPFDLPARLAVINASVYSGAAAPPPEVFSEQADYQRARLEPYYQVNVDTQMSIMSTWIGDQPSAERRALRAVALARQSRNPSSLAYSLWALGTALEDIDPIRAESLLGTALETARDVNNGWVTAIVQLSLASLRRRVRAPIDAIPLLLDLLDLLWRAGHRSHLWTTLRLCSLVLGDLHCDELAFELDGAVRGASMAMPALPTDAAAIEAQRARISAERGAEWVARTQAIAGTWDLESAISAVRTEFAVRLAAIEAE